MYKPALSALVILGIVLVFSCILYLEESASRKFHNSMIALNFLLICASVGAYLLLVRPGHVHWWALPLGWLLCLIPNYVYAYHIAKSAFFGPGLAFVSWSVLVILPSGLISLILCGVDLYLRSRS